MPDERTRFYSSQQQCTALGILCLKAGMHLQVRNMYSEHLCVWDEKGICNVADSVRNCR